MVLPEACDERPILMFTPSHHHTASLGPASLTSLATKRLPAIDSRQRTRRTWRPATGARPDGTGATGKVSQPGSGQARRHTRSNNFIHQTQNVEAERAFTTTTITIIIMERPDQSRRSVPWHAHHEGETRLTTSTRPARHKHARYINGSRDDVECDPSHRARH